MKESPAPFRLKGFTFRGGDEIIPIEPAKIAPLDPFLIAMFLPLYGRHRRQCDLPFVCEQFRGVLNSRIITIDLISIIDGLN
jgi:hypothetical protein